MKPRIALFGLPPRGSGKLHISVYTHMNGDTSQPSELIFDAENDDSGMLLDYLDSDIEIGYSIIIQITSRGICEHIHHSKFKGADISHVPFFRKELNLTDIIVSRDWDIDFWRQWNPQILHEEGLLEEKRLITNRTISTMPIWESYYLDGNIDYLEKFQKLWIGLNAYATYKSDEGSDRKKILSLVNCDLRQAFRESINNERGRNLAERLMRFQEATGVNMTSEIVRDEISRTCYSFDFLEKAKSTERLFSRVLNQLNGLTFLNNSSGNKIFENIFRKYHEYMASDRGISQPFNLAEAFSAPRAPCSIERYGRLIFHNPYRNSQSGNLFSLEDYLGTEYAGSPYQGQRDARLRSLEATDPLFFRYLNVLYEFRCAYFHGDLPPNKQNNELARTAYLSLYDLFPVIF